jgi:hypothetical protein
MSDPSPTSQRAPVPSWLVWLILIGVPAVIITVGKIAGATMIELIMFSLLCLFGLALVYFMR